MPTKNANPTGERRLRIKKRNRFAVKDSELNKLHRTVFLNYCRENMEHTSSEIVLLARIWDNNIDKDNIRNYISRTARELYHGLTNNCLHTYSLKVV